MAKPAIWVCGRGARAAALARALAREARVHLATLPAARLSTAAADAASVRLAERAWRTLGTVDAVIIVPTVATASGRRNPAMTAWRAGLDASVRASYLVARAAGVALERQGRGALLIVVETAPAADAIAAVASQALSCLVDTLARALGRAVRVGEMAVDGRGSAAAPLARALLQVLAAPPRGPSLVVRTDGGSAG